MAVADRHSLPIAAFTANASPHEVTLVAAVLDTRFVEPVPERLIGDKAYDSDPLDARLATQEIAMIAPHRKNRERLKMQDGRAAALQTALEDRALVRLARQLAVSGRAIRTICGELHRLRASRLYPDPAQTGFM